MEIYEKNNLHTELSNMQIEKDKHIMISYAVGLVDKESKLKESLEIDNKKQADRINQLEKEVKSLNRQLEIAVNNRKPGKIAGLHNRTEPLIEWGIARDYKSGRRVKDILETHEISSRTLYKILDRNNISLR